MMMRMDHPMVITVMGMLAVMMMAILMMATMTSTLTPIQLNGWNGF